MDDDPALKQLLEELSTLDVEGGMDVDLMPECGSHADINGKYVQIDPAFPEMVEPTVSEVNELRLICDTLNHELEHIRSSDLKGKQDFIGYYPEAPQVAGMVYNVLEDQYVDYQRIRRKPGFGRSRAYAVKLAMQTGEMMPPMSALSTAEQFPAAFKQLAFADYIKEPDALDEDVEAFLERVRPDILEVRRTHDQHDRKDLYHRVMLTLLEHAERAECDEDEAPNRERGDRPGEGGDETQMGEPFAGEMDKWAADDREDDPYIDPSLDEHEVDYERVDAEDVEFDSGPVDESAEMDDADAGEAGDAEGEGEGDETADDGDDDAEGEGEAHTDASESSEEGGDGEPAGGGESEATPRKEASVDPAAATADQRITDLGPDEIDRKYGTMEIDVERETSLDRKRHERYVEKRDSFDTKLEVKRRERDDRMRGRGSKLRSQCRKHVEDVVDEFREMASRDQPQPAVEGQRLSRRNVVRRAAGDLSENRVYEQMDTTVTGDRCVAVASDISGSMRSDIWELKMMLGTLGAATEAVGDTFLATTFTDNPANHGLAEREGPETVTEDALEMGVVIGPDEEFDWEKVDSFGARNNEPTAAGMAFAAELMDRVTSTEDVLFVITDGRSHVTRDGRCPGTDEPLHDIRQVKRDLEDDDVTVIGIGLGSVGDRDMNESFGDDWVRSDIDRLADDVIALYKERVTVE